MKSFSSVDAYMISGCPTSKPRMIAFHVHSKISFFLCFIKPIIEYLHFVICVPVNNLTINYTKNISTRLISQPIKFVFVLIFALFVVEQCSEKAHCANRNILLTNYCRNSNVISGNIS